MLDCLIIDDEQSIAQTVSEYFNLFGVTCHYTTSYDEGLCAIVEKQPSIALLDINLGEQSGFALCQKVRETSQVPIIFISARNTDDDILAALGIGGDDFMTKPFSLAVLLAKVKAMLKRSATPVVPQMHAPLSAFGDVTLERNTERVYKSDLAIKLKPMEWKLLVYMVENSNRVLSKRELLKNVWEDTYISEGTLSVHIRHLREKLEDNPNNPEYIKTAWGSGYMLEVSP